jgi:hypothetical protein
MKAGMQDDEWRDYVWLYDTVPSTGAVIAGNMMVNGE